MSARRLDIAARTAIDRREATAGGAGAATLRGTSSAVNRPLRALWGAAAIHADRFGRRRFVSLLTLASADQRITVPDGVAALTRVPSRRSLGGWVVGSVGAVALVCAAGLTASHWVTVASIAALAAITVVAGGVAVDRRLRARRTWRSAAGSWHLTDVAAVRGAGAGDQVVGEVVRRAEASSKPVVLTTRTEADRAIRLYTRHGFEQFEATAGLVRMRRAAVAPTIAPATYRPWAGTLGLTLAVGITVLSWPSPTAWLVPPCALVLTAAAIVDVERMRVPNLLTGVGFVGLLGAVGLLQLETGIDLVRPALAGALLFAGPLLVTHAVTNAHTPGLGDVKLAGTAGLICGAFDVRLALPALVASCVIGGAVGMTWQHGTSQRGFPLAPAIALGTALALACGAVLDWQPT